MVNHIKKMIHFNLNYIKMCTIYNAKNIVINKIVIGHAEKIVFECEQEFNDYFKAMDLNEQVNDYFTKENDYFTKELNEQEDEFDDYFNTIDFNSIYVL